MLTFTIVFGVLTLINAVLAGLATRYARSTREPVAEIAAAGTVLLLVFSVMITIYLGLRAGGAQ